MTNYLTSMDLIVLDELGYLLFAQQREVGALGPSGRHKPNALGSMYVAMIWSAKPFISATQMITLFNRHMAQFVSANDRVAE